MKQNSNLKQITAKQLINFWQEKIKFYRCPLCGSPDNWYPASTNDSKYLAISSIPIINEEKPSELRYYTCICDNCGNSIQFSCKVINDWLNKNEKANEQQG